MTNETGMSGLESWVVCSSAPETAAESYNWITLQTAVQGATASITLSRSASGIIIGTPLSPSASVLAKGKNHGNATTVPAKSY